MLLKAELVEREEISLKDLILLIWLKRALVISITIACGLIAMGVALLLPKQYRATALLAPVSSSGNAGRLSDQASSLMSLSSIIGISIGGDSQKYESIAVLQSRQLTEQYIKDNSLLRILSAPRTPIGRLWRQFFHRQKRPATLYEGAEKFASIRHVVEDRKTGLYTLDVTWTNPQMAAKWANDLVKLTNDYLRSRAIDIGERHIAYLNQEASHTDAAEVRAAIYIVLESEIKNVMLAKGPGDYALKVLDPALPPENSDSPKVFLWTLGGLVIGMLLSATVLFVHGAWQIEGGRQP